MVKWYFFNELFTSFCVLSISSLPGLQIVVQTILQSVPGKWRYMFTISGAFLVWVKVPDGGRIFDKGSFMKVIKLDAVGETRDPSPSPAEEHFEL